MLHPSHKRTVWHQNNNQGVTNAMRRQESQLHWQLRGQEMGNSAPQKKATVEMLTRTYQR